MVDLKRERARELQREYLREWRKRNRDKVKGYAESYWLRKAEHEAETCELQPEGSAINE